MGAKIFGQRQVVISGVTMDVKKQVSEYSSCVVTPAFVDIENGFISGCLYDRHGHKIEESERFGGFHGDHFFSQNETFIKIEADIETRFGNSIYLGHYMPHYGHFITETLSTFWYLVENRDVKFDWYFFHEFSMGNELTEAFLVCLDVFKIPMEKVVIVGSENKIFVCDKMTVPSRLWKLNHSVNVATKITYDFIAENIRNCSSESELLYSGKKIYLSRLRQSMKTANRIVANEYIIERIFESYGFEVVYPESLSFRNQVLLYSSASTIAGASGSALHNCLFMRSGSVVIELLDPRYNKPAPNQDICLRASSAKSHFYSKLAMSVLDSAIFWYDTKEMKCFLSSIFPDVRRIGYDFNFRILSGELKFETLFFLRFVRKYLGKLIKKIRVL